MAEYEPGVCNIGRAERLKRYAWGSLGLVAAFLVVFNSGLASLPSLTAGFMLFLVGFEGLLQAQLSFCTGFARAGVYDVSESGDDRQEIHDPDARKLDRTTALKINAASVGLAAVTTGLFWLIPL